MALPFLSDSKFANESMPSKTLVIDLVFFSFVSPSNKLVMNLCVVSLSVRFARVFNKAGKHSRRAGR